MTCKMYEPHASFSSSRVRLCHCWCHCMHALMLLLCHTACSADSSGFHSVRSGPPSAAMSTGSDHKAEGIWLPRSPKCALCTQHTRHIAATIRLHSWLTHTFCCLCITADYLMPDMEYMAAGQRCHAERFAVRAATRMTICLHSKLL